ncbi:YdjY domain-containing protein [Neorhodopirellula lusitana]|uniref:YdjY domain-containing protein n=1 Tax=Neorhodopirellula lusitana TaxID=445327 RepID=UPI00384EF03D
MSFFASPLRPFPAPHTSLPSTKRILTFALIGVGLLGVCITAGCRKSEPPASPPPATATETPASQSSETDAASAPDLVSASPKSPSTNARKAETGAPKTASSNPNSAKSAESSNPQPTDAVATASNEMQSQASNSAANKDKADAKQANAELATAPQSLPKNESLDGQPLTTEELEEEYVPDPEILAELEAQRQALRRIADTYDPPPGATQLGKQPDLWVDMKAKRIYVDGYVSMRRGPLEMLACPVGTKEHESVIALFAKSSEVHAALLAIGAQSGTTARWVPEFQPPTGQPISIWIVYREHEPNGDDQPTEDEPRIRQFVPGKELHVADARDWVRNVETQESLKESWVFSGSEFWTDPEENIEHYSADAGDMICVSNFSTAMMDVPFASSADAGNLLFQPFSERVPEPGTPVRLVLVPQPFPGSKPTSNPSIDPKTPPDPSVLPSAQNTTTGQEGESEDANAGGKDEPDA